MEAFLTSLGLVVLAEMGDKTQILAVLLAARFKKPWAVSAGILAATVGNHLLAGFVGIEAAGFLSASWLHWILAAMFAAMAVWTLVPDKMDDGKGFETGGAFTATMITFFLVEMGDKTQLATVALAARYHDLIAVAAGTTAGMLLADLPVVFLGEKLTQWIPARIMRIAAALSFGASAVWILAEA